MSPTAQNLVTNIILGTATVTDFSSVSVKWTEIYGLFDTEDDDFNILDTLLDFGMASSSDFNDGIYIFATSNLAHAKAGTERYRIYHADWDKRNYFVRFPDGRIEEIE